MVQERTFIIGPHGGKQGTVAVTNFTDHNPSIFDWPDPATPIPYTELLINAMPGYRKKTAAGTARHLADFRAVWHARGLRRLAGAPVCMQHCVADALGSPRAIHCSRTWLATLQQLVIIIDCGDDAFTFNCLLSTLQMCSCGTRST